VHIDELNDEPPASSQKETVSRSEKKVVRAIRPVPGVDGHATGDIADGWDGGDGPRRRQRPVSAMKWSDWWWWCDRLLFFPYLNLPPLTNRFVVSSHDSRARTARPTASSVTRTDHAAQGAISLIIWICFCMLRDELASSGCH
jgi:hypothetical protein